jgi:hypothetical protein
MSARLKRKARRRKCSRVMVPRGTGVEEDQTEASGEATAEVGHATDHEGRDIR